MPVIVLLVGKNFLFYFYNHNNSKFEKPNWMKTLRNILFDEIK